MASSPTSIAVTGRSMFADSQHIIHRVSALNGLPTRLLIVYYVNPADAEGIRVIINGITSGVTIDYFGTGLRFIVTNSASLPSTVRIQLMYAAGVYGSILNIITIQEISPTLDFIAVTTQYSATSPCILRLPPVTAHNRPIFIKLARNTTASNDGVWIITRGDSFIEFETRDTEVVGGTTCNHSAAVFIGGQSSGGAAVNYACITLFSDGSNWYVANYYPMNTSASFNQYLLAGLSDANPVPAKLATANASGVNIFKNGVALRQSENNMVLLPTPTSPSICMIVYGGNQGTRATGNALIIKDPRVGSWIDGFSANSPCILIDADNGGGNAKSTGIVLFYDPTGSGKWYVIGWFYPALWTFSNLTAAVGDINGYHSIKDVVTPAGEERKICVVPDIAGARFYTLPLETATNPQVIIFKAKDIGSGDNRGIRYSTLRVIGFGPAPTFTPIIDSRDDNRINTDTISIQYGSGGATNARSKYSCVWFVSEQVTGESFLRYYPVVSYVPNP